MEDEIIYKNDPKRTLIVSGIGFFVIAIGLFRGVYWDDYGVEISGLYVGIALFGLGLVIKGVFGFFNRKPQLIISKRGLFIGLNENRELAWKNIESINVKQEPDKTGRQIWLLKIRAVKNKGGDKSYKVFSLNMDLLKIDRHKIIAEIDSFRNN